MKQGKARHCKKSAAIATLTPFALCDGQTGLVPCGEIGTASTLLDAPDENAKEDQEIATAHTLLGKRNKETAEAYLGRVQKRGSPFQ